MKITIKLIAFLFVSLLFSCSQPETKSLIKPNYPVQHSVKKSNDVILFVGVLDSGKQPIKLGSLSEWNDYDYTGRQGWSLVNKNITEKFLNENIRLKNKLKIKFKGDKYNKEESDSSLAYIITDYNPPFFTGFSSITHDNYVFATIKLTWVVFGKGQGRGNEEDNLEIKQTRDFYATSKIINRVNGRLNKPLSVVYKNVYAEALEKLFKEISTKDISNINTIHFDDTNTFIDFQDIRFKKGGSKKLLEKFTNVKCNILGDCSLATKDSIKKKLLNRIRNDIFSKVINKARRYDELKSFVFLPTSDKTALLMDHWRVYAKLFKSLAGWNTIDVKPQFLRLQPLCLDNESNDLSDGVAVKGYEIQSTVKSFDIDEIKKEYNDRIKSDLYYSNIVSRVVIPLGNKKLLIAPDPKMGGKQAFSVQYAQPYTYVIDADESELDFEAFIKLIDELSERVSDGILSRIKGIKSFQDKNKSLKFRKDDYCIDSRLN